MRSDKRPYLGTNVDGGLFRAQSKLLWLTEPCRVELSRAEPRPPLGWDALEPRLTLSARCVGQRRPTRKANLIIQGGKTHLAEEEMRHFEMWVLNTGGGLGGTQESGAQS